MQQSTVHRLNVSSEPGPEPIVVFVHGTLDRGSSFARVRRALKGVRATVAYDRRGYHRSHQLGPATLAQHADDLAAIIDGRRCVVVGHSFGGLVAAKATADPEYRAVLTSNVLGLLLYEPPAPWANEWPPDSAAALALAVRDNPPRAIEAFFTTMVGVDIWNALSAETKTQRRAEGPALLADLDSAHPRRGDCHQSPVDFDEIGIPTQCVYGERSPAHLADSAKYIATMIPSAQLTEMAGASHGPHLSDPVGFAQLVEGFVKSVTT